MRNRLVEAGTSLSTNECPLCQGRCTEPYYSDAERDYQQCNHCKLVFVPCHFWLTRDEEKGVYDLHKNDPEDGGYLRFLSRMATPLLERLEGQCHGLDFGCGPGPALFQLFHEHKHQVKLYDPLYYNDPTLLSQKYDFICATEVVEHLQSPASELTRIVSLLKPGAWLGIMTKLVIDKIAFRNWHYIRDPTHICFFSRATLVWLAEHYNLELTIAGKDVFLFRKPC